MSAHHMVIVGAGPAGGAAARALRDHGFDGDVTLLGAEPRLPYIRPPLSKQYLRGEADRDSVFMEPAAWYEERRIDVRTGKRVAAIDPARHSLRFESGDVLSFDALLLATGSTPRALEIEGAELNGVQTLRTLDDADALRERLGGGEHRVVVIGSGWLGMEVAASARMLGNRVTVVARGAQPLSSMLGDDVGAFFAQLHRDNGVQLRPSAGVGSIAGEGGAVCGVVLGDGELIPADVVLIAVGAAPNVALAESAGLAVDDGVLVDDRLRSSAPDIYAAGDIANALHPLGGVRVRNEHFSTALKTGAAAAGNMLGGDAAFDAVPTFISEQFDVTVQFAGFAPRMRGATIVERGDRASRSFSAFWVADGRAVAGVHLNVPDREKAMQGLIRSGRPVDPARLADATIPLEAA